MNKIEVESAAVNLVVSKLPTNDPIEVMTDIARFSVIRRAANNDKYEISKEEILFAVEQRDVYQKIAIEIAKEVVQLKDAINYAITSGNYKHAIEHLKFLMKK